MGPQICVNIGITSSKSLSPLHFLDALLLEDVSVVLDLGHRRLLLRLDHGALPICLGLLRSQKANHVKLHHYKVRIQVIAGYSAVSWSKRYHL